MEVKESVIPAGEEAQGKASLLREKYSFQTWLRDNHLPRMRGPAPSNCGFLSFVANRNVFRLGDPAHGLRSGMRKDSVLNIFFTEICLFHFSG